MSDAAPPPSKEDILQACADGKLDQVLSFLPQCKDGPTQGEIIEKAAANGQAAIIRHFLANGIGPYGHRAYAAAAVRSRSPLALEALLDASLDINKEMGYEGTPVLFATLLWYHPSYIEWLLNRGADPNIGRASTYYSGLHLAVLRDTPDLLKIYLKHGAQVKGSKALLEAAMRGKFEMLKILVEHAPEDINDMPDEDDEWCDGPRDVGTALHAAARHGHVEMVKYLLEKGADPWLKDVYGKTARELAEAEGHTEIVSMLSE